MTHKLVHTVAHLQDSLFVGRSFSNERCRRVRAVLLPVSMSGPLGISPGRCGSLGGAHKVGIWGFDRGVGSYPALLAQTRVARTTFLRYGSTDCGSEDAVLETLMEGSQDSSDGVPPLFFDGTTIDATSRAHMINMKLPKRNWINTGKCGVMDCDGPKQVIIHDMDGTLTGLGAGASILGRSDFMHETRADPSKFTWYNIPTKMLYDPCPLNNPAHPGWDTSELADLLGSEGGLFTYRRRLLEEGCNSSRPPTAASLEMDRQRERGSAGHSTGGAALPSAEPLPAATNPRRLSEESELQRQWKDRMVFYTGDERAFFADLSKTVCESASALYDPSCRTERQTHAEVAYSSYGVYRGEVGSGAECTLRPEFNAWVCPTAAMTPMRLIVENMDEDHTSRVLVPVTLASGGYVQLMNGGWDHQSGCGGYECMRRLMTFWSTVAVNRSYDLAFTATNPEHLRLMLPFGSGETTATGRERSRLVVSIYYSNPQKLIVFWNRRRVQPLEHHMPSANSFNFSMRKPTIDDPCGSNAFAAWENKLYMTLCGGVPGVEIKTTKMVTLSLGIELPVEDFFDQHYLVRNLASLFGIPAARMRVPKIVAGSTRRRRLSGGEPVGVDITVDAPDACAEVKTCGPHGECDLAGECLCEDGWETPSFCAEGDCLCSQREGCPTGCESCDAHGACVGCSASNRTNALDSLPLLRGGVCVSECPADHAVVTSTSSGYSSCLPCHATCGGACLGPAADQCVVCDTVGVHAYLLDGQCVQQCPVGYYADEARACMPCSARCQTCSGPRATDCTGCRPNLCMKQGRCPAGVVFPLLEVRIADIFSFKMVDDSFLVLKNDRPVSVSSAWGCGHWSKGGMANCNRCRHHPPGLCSGARGSAAWSGSGPMLQGIVPDHYGRCQRSAPSTVAVLPELAQVGCIIRDVIPWSSEGGTIAEIHKTPAVGHCISNCPAGQYAHANGVCRKCDLACTTCSGPSSKSCTDPTPRTPFLDADCSPGAVRTGGSCALICPAGESNG